MDITLVRALARDWSSAMSERLSTACEVETRLFDPPQTRRVFDVERIAYLMAAHQSARFFERHMRLAQNLVTPMALLEFALARRTVPGLTMEFGVATGRTLRAICAQTNGMVYGFDGFEGLPQDWTHFQKRGRFSSYGAPPPDLPTNSTLVIGWFHDTLPDFLAKHPDPVSFVHVDCDLYSSTKITLDLLAPRLQPGTILVFDEYFNYPGWKHNEHRAFTEFIARTGKRAEYFAFASSGQAVAVRLLS